MSERGDLAVIKAKIPKSLKDFVVKQSMMNDVSLRVFMTYIVSSYETIVSEFKSNILKDVMSFKCDDDIEQIINFQVTKELKNRVKTSYVKSGNNERLFVIASIKYYKNNMDKPREEDQDVTIY